MLDAVPVPGLQPCSSVKLHPLALCKAARWHTRVWSLSGVKVLFVPAQLMLPLLLCCWEVF